jgi:hypothetical protein
VDGDRALTYGQGVRRGVWVLIGGGFAVGVLVGIGVGAAHWRPSPASIERQLDRRTGNATFSCSRFGILSTPQVGTDTADMPSNLAAGTTVYDCRTNGAPGKPACTGLAYGKEPVVVRAQIRTGEVREGRPCADYAQL